ncbi:MAG: hypothetical protein ACRENE_24660 [Polyangiaceae bacterium]
MRTSSYRILTFAFALAPLALACSSSSSGGGGGTPEDGSASSSGGTSSSSGAGTSSSSGSGSGSSSGSGSGSGGSSSSGGSDAGAPTLTITTAGDASLAVTTAGSMKTVNIAFTVTNFTLMAPGTCPGGATNTGCGHIHVLVDGSTCTPSGSPYNNADTTGSPAVAILSNCPTVNGMHTVTLELHNDAHGALTPPVSASVMISATGG